MAPRGPLLALGEEGPPSLQPLPRVPLLALAGVGRLRVCACAVFAPSQSRAKGAREDGPGLHPVELSCCPLFPLEKGTPVLHRVRYRLRTPLPAPSLRAVNVGKDP